MSKRKIAVAVIALVAMVAILVGVWVAFAPKGTAGNKAITVEVVYADASSKTFPIQTDAEFLRQALEQQDLVKGEDGEFGLFVKTVDGITADDSKQEWWCFTKGGEQVTTSVDATPIASGEHFEITLTTGY